MMTAGSHSGYKKSTVPTSAINAAKNKSAILTSHIRDKHYIERNETFFTIPDGSTLRCSGHLAFCTAQNVRKNCAALVAGAFNPGIC